MRFLFFLILFLSAGCFAQITPVKKNFFTLYPIDSLIQGDWNLVESYVNGAKVKRTNETTRLKITVDSLLSISNEKRLLADQLKEFSYEVKLDPGSDFFHLNIFRKKKKKVLYHYQFDCLFRNFDELVISYESYIEDGVGNVPIKIVYVYKRFQTDVQSYDPLDQNWFYCPKENEGFGQRMQSDKSFIFYRDTAYMKPCSNKLACFNFKRSIYQVSWALEKEDKTFQAFFGSDAEIFLSEKRKKMYLFNGSSVLVYTIEELDPDKMILKQDNEATKKFNN